MADDVVSACATCGQEDNHPKHIFAYPVAQAYGKFIFDERDLDQDGYLDYHLDCLPPELEDEADPNHVEAAKSGVHGDKLRALIVGESE